MEEGVEEVELEEEVVGLCIAPVCIYVCGRRMNV